MSEIRVDSIKNQAGTGSPTFPNGLTLTGIVTAASGIVTYYGDGSKLTGISVGTTASYANVSGYSTTSAYRDWETANINTTGIITASTINGTYTGTWNGVGIGTTYGGTGITTYTAGDILYSSASNTLSKLPIGSSGQVLTVSAGLPAWAASAVVGS